MAKKEQEQPKEPPRETVGPKEGGTTIITDAEPSEEMLNDG